MATDPLLPAPAGASSRGDVRLFAIGAVGLLALLLAGSALLLRVAEALVPRTQVDAIESRDQEDAEALGDVSTISTVQNVLVVGLDSRENLTEEERELIHANDSGSRLTDTIMWVQYDPEDDQLRLVSFPRDLAVYPGGQANPVKLNSLHFHGGPDLLVSTLEDMVGADLDHYVEVDLAGFLRLAETLGGIQVCLQSPIDDWRSGLDLPAGCQQLTPAQATGFVRARHVSDEFGSGTAGRAARQQYFIRQAVGEVVSAGTLTSPTRVRALIDLARQSVVVDEGFSTGELLAFANSFRSFDADRIIGANVPFTSRRFDDGLFYDELTENAEDLFEALRDGRELPDEAVSPTTSESESDAVEPTESESDEVVAGSTDSPDG